MRCEPGSGAGVRAAPQIQTVAGRTVGVAEFGGHVPVSGTGGAGGESGGQAGPGASRNHPVGQTPWGCPGPGALGPDPRVPLPELSNSSGNGAGGYALGPPTASSASSAPRERSLERSRQRDEDVPLADQEVRSTVLSSARGSDMDCLRHVVFDLDGTLVDSLPGIRWSIDAAGIPVRRRDLKALIGPPIRQILAELSGLADGPALDRLERAFRASYDSAGWRRTVCQRGAATMLRWPRDPAECRSGWSPTSRPRPPAGFSGNCALAGFFTETVCRDSRTPAFESKAEMLLDLLRRRGLRPAETLMVGDTLEDARAAEAAGIDCDLVSHGYGRGLDGPCPPTAGASADGANCCSGAARVAKRLLPLPCGWGNYSYDRPGYLRRALRPGDGQQPLGPARSRPQNRLARSRRWCASTTCAPPSSCSSATWTPSSTKTSRPHRYPLHQEDARHADGGRRLRRAGEGHPQGGMHSHGDALRREIGRPVLRARHPHPQDRQLRPERLAAASRRSPRPKSP